MLLRKIQYCMLDMLEDDGLVIPYDLLIFDVVKCAQTSFSFQHFLFWYFNITISINTFRERFEFIYDRNQTFSVLTNKMLVLVFILLVSQFYPDSKTIRETSTQFPKN